MGSLIADLGSSLAALTPASSIAAITGMGATFTQFGADASKSRGGLE